MQELNRNTIDKLQDDNPRSPAVTMYVPTHRVVTSPNMTEDQVRFKNLSNKALKILEQRDKHNDFNDFFSKKFESYLNDRALWENRTETMLVCARPNKFEVYDLPIDSDEYVAVDEHHHLAPLYGLLTDNIPFRVLTVTQHGPVLFEGDMYKLQPSTLKLPTSIEDALNIDEKHQRSVQYHTGNQAGATQYHGHGSAKDSTDTDRIRFLRIIDERINKSLKSDKPLILAGIDSEVAEYRDISNYPKILSNSIHGSFNPDDSDKLFGPALDIMQKEVIQPEHDRQIERYERVKGESPDLASDRPAAIKDAADKGRVDTLLIGVSRKTSDTVRDNMREVPKLIFASEKESQAIEEIAHTVWNQSGKVFNVYEDKLPGASRMYAIFRY